MAGDEVREQPNELALYNDLQLVLAGHTVGRVLQALFDANSMAICASFPTVEQAHAFVDDGYAEDLKRDITKNFHLCHAQQEAADRPPQ